MAQRTSELEPTYTVFDAGSHLPLRLVTDAIEASRFAPEAVVCQDPATGRFVYLMCGAHKSLCRAPEPDSLESNFPTMTTSELREWLAEIELCAQDAWTDRELASLRRDRDSVRAEIARRAK